MTEICFQRCTSNFNYRNLTMDEERCVDNCAGKLIRSNHRLMGTYVQLMPQMVQRRMEEMESKAAENAKAAEAAASAHAGPPATEALPASQSSITSSPPLQIPPLLTPSVTDVGLQADGSSLKPAGLDIPVELDSPVSKSAISNEVNLSAATALTPAAEAVIPSVLNDAGSGPSFAASLPQPPIAGAQIESQSSGPMFTPSNPTFISADVPVSAVPAPTVSQSKESAPELPPVSNQ